MGKDLDFGNGTWEQAGAVVRSTLQEHHDDLNGNGHPGLKDDMVEIKAYGKATTFWAKMLFALLTLLATIAGFYFKSFEEERQKLQQKEQILINRLPNNGQQPQSSPDE